MTVDKNDFIYMKIYNDIYEKIKSKKLADKTLQMSRRFYTFVFPKKELKKNGRCHIQLKQR